MYRIVDAFNCPEYAPLTIQQGQMRTASNRKPSELVRGLGLWASTAVIIGGMVGVSIFLVSSQVARDLGSVDGALAAWLIGGVTLMGAIASVEGKLGRSVKK